MGRCTHAGERTMPMLAYDGRWIDDAIVAEATCDPDGCSEAYAIDATVIEAAGYVAPDDPAEIETLVYESMDALSWG